MPACACECKREYAYTDLQSYQTNERNRVETWKKALFFGCAVPVVAQQTNLFACICSSKAYVIASDAAYVPADPTRGPSASCHCSAVQPCPCAACCSSSSCLPAHTCAPQHTHSGPGAAMRATRRMQTRHERCQAARTRCLLSRQSRLLLRQLCQRFSQSSKDAQRRPKEPSYLIISFFLGPSGFLSFRHRTLL